MKAAAKSVSEGEGSDALAFCIAGALAGVILLPATQLLDLKAAAGWLVLALGCLLGTRILWRGRVGSAAACLGPALRLWRWSAVAVAGYALAQRFGIEPMAAYALAGSRERAMGSFGNAGYLAAFLVLSWPLLLAWSGSRRVVGLGLLWAALLATQSRAGLLAWAVQLLVLAGTAWRGGWRPGGKLWAAGGGLALLAAVLFPPSVWTRATLRWPLWRAAAGLWLQRPWLGWAPEPFALAFQQHGDPSLLRVLNDAGQYAEDPHQLGLAVLCAVGLLGFAVFALVLVLALRAAFRSPLPGAGLALLGVLVESQFDRFFFHAGVLAPLLLLGAALWPWALPAGRQRQGRALALVLLALAAACSAAALRPVLAYRHAVGSDMGAGALAVAPAASVDQLQAAAQGSVDPAAFERLGAALAAQQRYAEAAAAYRQAQRLSPSTGRAQNLGNCLMMLGDAQGAEAAYRKAVELDPRRSDAHFSLGYALFYQKRLKQAVDELDLALKLDPGNDSARKLKEQMLQ